MDGLTLITGGLTEPDHSGDTGWRIAGVQEATESALISIPKMVEIPASTFRMGSPGSFTADAAEEEGRNPDEFGHTVTISRAYHLGTTEVTFAQWTGVREWASRNGYTDLPVGRNGVGGDGSGQHPVTEVNWRDIAKWCNALSEKDGRTPVYTVDGNIFKTGYSDRVECNWDENGFRLPTEAEWEYACRAGTTRAFYTGSMTERFCELDSNLDRAGWYCGNSGDKTHPVGEKEKNDFGLFDMHGNVWEWCWDWYGIYRLQSSAQIDPKGEDRNFSFNRVRRGGSWSSNARYCRSAYRSWAAPSFRDSFQGFRLCLRSSF